MDEYYRILESLPPALRTPLAKLDAHYAPHIQEIRLRLGQPVQFTIRGRLCPAAKFLHGTGLPAALETDTLRDCFLQLCRRGVSGIFFTPIGGAVIMQARHKIFIPEYCIWNCGRGRGCAVNTEWAHHAAFFFFLVHHGFTPPRRQSTYRPRQGRNGRA